MHRQELDEVPGWVDKVIRKARSKAEGVGAQYFMCHLGGAEISMDLATSETEYNVTLTRVNERIE